MNIKNTIIGQCINIRVELHVLEQVQDTNNEQNNLIHLKSISYPISIYYYFYLLHVKGYGWANGEAQISDKCYIVRCVHETLKNYNHKKN